jgi:hypothetical protein
MIRSITIICVLSIFSTAAIPCLAQEPAPGESIDNLRREIAELRKQVAELAKRVEELEYQRLPGIRNTQPPAERPPVGVRPANAPAAEPVGSKLRFPYGIERGNPPLPAKAPPDLPDLRFDRSRR